MKVKALGRTMIQVSELCLGTMTFGTEADEQASAAIFHRCRDVGVNFFDTADVYGGGRSEEILGKLVEGVRQEVVLSTKAFFPMGKGVNARGLSRKHLRHALEQSLRRLRTDYIDLYHVHGIDSSTSLEEVVCTLDLFVRQGKILHSAASNWSAWQVARALGKAETRGLSRFDSIQPMYSLLKRQAEVELLPLAKSEGLAVTPYSPLGGGMLTGKYLESGVVAGRLTSNQAYGKRYGNPSHAEATAKFVRHAAERGVHAVSLAIAWAGSHPAVTAPIVGARSVEQLEPQLRAPEIPMTPEWRAEISALSRDPGVATDRSEETVIEGRKA